MDRSETASDRERPEPEASPFRPANLVLVFCCTLAALILALGRPQGWEASAAVFLGLALAPLALHLLSQRYPLPVVRWADALFPGPAFYLMYGRLNPLCNLLHPVLEDAWLQQVDRLIFGVQPGVWLAPRLSPGVNDLLMLCYASYYIWPNLVGILYLHRRDDSSFNRWALAITLASMINYACYMAVPAMGPRFMLAGAFPGPIVGHLWAGGMAEAFRHSPYLRDCFPSGHTTLTLMVLIESWRRVRRLFWIELPVTVGLIVATVACRFHYGIDLIAAVPLAIVSLWIAEVATRIVPARLLSWRGLVRST